MIMRPKRHPDGMQDRSTGPVAADRADGGSADPERSSPAASSQSGDSTFTRPPAGSTLSADSNDSAGALALARQQLWREQQENARLRADNDRMRRQLDAATRRSEEAQHLAHHDGLTGLPNRRLLEMCLQQRVAEAIEGNGQLAMLLVDLDGFKLVNDRFGHLVGDLLLKVVATRIAACVRSDDIVFRYGGDEFVVLLANVNDPEIAGSIAGKIREQIGRAYRIEGNQIQVSASIGRAVHPRDGEHCDALLRCADASMYREKSTNFCRQG